MVNLIFALSDFPGIAPPFLPLSSFITTLLPLISNMPGAPQPAGQCAYRKPNPVGYSGFSLSCGVAGCCLSTLAIDDGSSNGSFAVKG